MGRSSTDLQNSDEDSEDGLSTRTGRTSLSMPQSRMSSSCAIYDQGSDSLSASTNTIDMSVPPLCTPPLTPRVTAAPSRIQVQAASSGESGAVMGPAQVGQRVRVNGFCEGVLRFYGSHHRDGKPRCGVSLDQPIGLNNGTVGVCFFLSLSPLLPLVMLTIGRTISTSRAQPSMVCWWTPALSLCCMVMLFEKAP